MFENVVLNNVEEDVFQDNYMEKKQDVFIIHMYNMHKNMALFS